MARTLVELQEENPDQSIDMDNIYMIYESDEETEFTSASTTISNYLANYFSQDARLYIDWENARVNSETSQRGMRIKAVMYDIIAECLTEAELDRIEILEVINGPWYVIPEDPGYIPVPPDPVIPPEPEEPV